MTGALGAWKWFVFGRKYRICAICAIALNRKFLSFRKVENFVNYKVSSYMGDAAKKSSTDIRGRKFHWVLWITPLTGGKDISLSCFLLFRFLVQITISEYKWQKIYPLFPSLVERKFSCGQVWMNRNWSLFQLILLSWPTAQHGDSNSDQICFFPFKVLIGETFYHLKKQLSFVFVLFQPIFFCILANHQMAGGL